MHFQLEEIVETLSMVQMDHFDIRTVTLGLSLRDCANSDGKALVEKVRRKVMEKARNLARTVNEVSAELGIPVANRRIALTPLSLVLEPCARPTFLDLPRMLDDVAAELGVDFVGGYSALIQKSWTPGDRMLIDCMPEVLATTKRVCASVNVASTRAGIHMDAVRRMGEVIKEAAQLTSSTAGFGAAKLVVFANAVDDNPFMAGAFHGVAEGDAALSVGISGPGVIRQVVARHAGADFGELAEAIKRAAFKITRVGQLVLAEVSRRMGLPPSVVDLSLAPTPVPGDSVGGILEAMGLERFGAPGSTAALAMLNESVKRGGAMAATYVGGLSGAFVPVAEDTGIADAVRAGSLTIEKLEAMTSVCSVGLDMVVIPGDTSAATIAGILADECAIGVMNNKTTACRIIPVPGATVGQTVDFGGLFGSSPVMAVSPFQCTGFVGRTGRIPAPLKGLTN